MSVCRKLIQIKTIKAQLKKHSHHDKEIMVEMKLFPFQRLGGKIENVSSTDLVGHNNEFYLLVLQNLKEKAIEIEKLINETEDISDLEKQLMKVIPTMNLVRTMVKLTSLYKENYQGGNNGQGTILSQEKQTAIQVYWTHSPQNIHDLHPLQALIFSLHKHDFLLAKHSWQISHLSQSKV